MFGHQDDQSPRQDTQGTNDIPDESIHGVLNDNKGGPAAQPPAPDPDNNVVKPDSAATPASPAAPQSDDDDHAGPHLDTPPANDQEPIKDIISPAGGFPKRPTYQYPSAAAAEPPVGPNSLGDGADEATHELVDIKQRALGELSPLIDKLDLPAEEKFRTIMMMVQASDDQTMVKAAYAAAHSIKDEKVRAQALLDIINEVNYFTQQPEV